MSRLPSFGMSGQGQVRVNACGALTSLKFEVEDGNLRDQLHVVRGSLTNKKTVCDSEVVEKGVLHSLAYNR
jgi:hypothetical protein